MATLVTILLLIIVPTAVNGQCFTPNDRQISSTPTIVSQLLDGYTQFAFNLFRSVNGAPRNGTDTVPAGLPDRPPTTTQPPTYLIPGQNVTQVDRNRRREPDDSKHNIFLSPASVWSALLVAHLGARGDTEAEIGAALGLTAGAPKVGVARAYRFLKTWYYLRAHIDDAPFVFRMANHVYLQEGQPLRTCLETYLGPEDVAVANFATQPEQARLDINAWVEGETNRKIRDLLPGGSVDSSTRLVLVNAAYFKGTWVHQFDKKKTDRVAFTVRPGAPTIRVDMMHVKSDFRYVKSAALGCELLELPYAGDQLSMFVLLPDENSSVDALIGRHLTGTAFSKLAAEATHHRVAVSLPKFKMEEALELRPHLSELGVRQLFDPVRCDLSGFTGSGEMMQVGSVRHKAHVDVGEEGTEAAAATGFLAFRDNVHAYDFVANRPFVFVIRDNLLDTVLFVGALRRPEPSDESRREPKQVKRRNTKKRRQESTTKPFRLLPKLFLNL